MKYDVLIVIDMQAALIGLHPYQERNVIENIKELMQNCRKASVPVIHVRHDGGLGDELESGSKGWQIYHELAPQNGELVIDKRFNSAFRQTGLHPYLQSVQAENILMCGMQTEYCFDVSCKVAFEYGYHVVIPKGATTTYDSEYFSAKILVAFYEEKIWNHRYAEVLPMKEIVKDIK